MTSPPGWRACGPGSAVAGPSGGVLKQTAALATHGLRMSKEIYMSEMVSVTFKGPALPNSPGWTSVVLSYCTGNSTRGVQF